MAKMRKSTKVKWLKALRSGLYRQGPEELHNTASGTFCCLGVLQAVCGGKSSPDGDELLTDGAHNLSDKVQRKLATMNDDRMSFIDIARYISRNL